MICLWRQHSLLHSWVIRRYPILCIISHHHSRRSVDEYMVMEAAFLVAAVEILELLSSVCHERGVECR